jgi:hypothetical protein
LLFGQIATDFYRGTGTCPLSAGAGRRRLLCTA